MLNFTIEPSPQLPPHLSFGSLGAASGGFKNRLRKLLTEKFMVKWHLNIRSTAPLRAPLPSLSYFAQAKLNGDDTDNDETPGFRMVVLNKNAQLHNLSPVRNIAVVPARWPSCHFHRVFRTLSLANGVTSTERLSHGIAESAQA